MKDNFSEQSDEYARFRPGYPKELFAYLESLVIEKENAWDVGTGNGQVAVKLSWFFKKVYGTDISSSQLKFAVKRDNIIYSLQPAEKTNFEDNFFDLCMVAQAIHWFDFKKFYREIYRTAKHNSLLAVTGYGLLKITDELDSVIFEFYSSIVGNYWDPERKYIEDNYTSILFPFTEINAPDFEQSYNWNFDQLIGYLGTWSAVKKFRTKTGNDPIEIIIPDLKDKWGGEITRKVSFPLLLRIGRIDKISV